MSIPDGYSDIPSGKMAAVVISLQMFQRPPARSERCGASPVLVRAAPFEPDAYRDLYRRIGENWLWFSRLGMSDAELRGILEDPAYETYVLKERGRDEGPTPIRHQLPAADADALAMEVGDGCGLAELDFRTEGECEIAFFGLMPGLIGRGAGRWMMNRVIDIAWSRPIDRLWLHTCSYDHPGALNFYIRSGFVPFRRQIEVVDDPRMTGLLPRSAAIHVPLL